MTVPAVETRCTRQCEGKTKNVLTLPCIHEVMSQRTKNRRSRIGINGECVCNGGNGLPKASSNGKEDHEVGT